MCQTKSQENPQRKLLHCAYTESGLTKTRKTIKDEGEKIKEENASICSDSRNIGSSAFERKVNATTGKQKGKMKIKSPSLVGAGAGAWAWTLGRTMSKARSIMATRPSEALGIAAISSGISLRFRKTGSKSVQRPWVCVSPKQSRQVFRQYRIPTTARFFSSLITQIVLPPFLTPPFVALSVPLGTATLSSASLSVGPHRIVHISPSTSLVDSFVASGNEQHPRIGGLACNSHDFSSIRCGDTDRVH
ncbi:hypothetical protein BHE74_00046724 [Ensete ventricosum]|nr:hypothetical protein BHE74_00046724 [Ensete ventricosum]